MNIDIKATGLELTGPLREYVNRKISSLEKYLKRFGSTSVKVQVEVARTTKHHLRGDVYYAEVNLSLPGKLLRAEDRGPDVKVVVDKVRRVLRREIKRYKGRLDS